LLARVDWQAWLASEARHGQPEVWRLCALAIALLRSQPLAAAFAPASASGTNSCTLSPLELLELFYAPDALPGVSRALRAQLRAFVITQLLPFLGAHAGAPLVTDLLIAAMRRTLAAPAPATATASALSVLLRLAGRSAAAASRWDDVLERAGLPGELSSFAAVTPDGAVRRRVMRLCVRSMRGAAPAIASTLAVSPPPLLRSLASLAVRGVLDMRPQQAAAARAAMSRSRQQPTAAAEAGCDGEQRRAAMQLEILAELLPVASAADAPSAQLLEQLQELGRTASTSASRHGAARAQQHALLHALGALLSRLDGAELPLLLRHARWIQGLLEAELRDAMTDADAARERWGIVRNCHRCLACLCRLAEPWVQQAASSEPGADAQAVAELVLAAVERDERLMQLLLRWLVADAGACARQLSMQHMLVGVLTTLHALPPALLPAPPALAPLVALFEATAAPVRYHAFLVFSDLPPPAATATAAPTDTHSAALTPEAVALHLPGGLPRLMGLEGADAVVDSHAAFLAWAAALRIVEHTDPPTQAAAAHARQP
jgi:hypothetical protein